MKISGIDGIRLEKYHKSNNGTISFDFGGDAQWQTFKVSNISDLGIKKHKGKHIYMSIFVERIGDTFVLVFIDEGKECKVTMNIVE